MSKLQDEIKKRRTFAIISHPDAGKTTLTEKSQLQNKNKAFALLRTKLYDLELQRRQEEEKAERLSQIGTGDRSEKIRTYNFPQGRVTDHRINLTLYKLDKIMNGDIQEILDALIAADQAKRLVKMNESA